MPESCILAVCAFDRSPPAYQLRDKTVVTLFRINSTITILVSNFGTRWRYNVQSWRSLRSTQCKGGPLWRPMWQHPWPSRRRKLDWFGPSQTKKYFTVEDCFWLNMGTFYRRHDSRFWLVILRCSYQSFTVECLTAGPVFILASQNFDKGLRAFFTLAPLQLSISDSLVNDPVIRAILLNSVSANRYTQIAAKPTCGISRVAARCV